MPRERIQDARVAEQRVLFGPMDQHLRAIREHFGVRITARRGVLLIEGEDAVAVRDVSKRVKSVLQRMRSGREPSTDEVGRILMGEDGVSSGDRASRGAPGASGGPARPLAAPVPAPGNSVRTGPVVPKTPGQQTYVDAIGSHDVVMAVGPAGTGKTFLAVVAAIKALREGNVRRIILVRPAVEAGESLGFLPGDFQAKINPYLRPLYDALAEMISWAEVQRYMGQDVIEIVPLAYMRGRTLKDAFIILDEAQNTTAAQMKMFLTRMGEGSRIVITGDITQIDLPDGSRSGLIESMRILKGVKGIAQIRFTAEDIIRHALVQQIVDAYEREESWPDRPAPRPSRAAAAQAGGEAEAPASAVDASPEAAPEAASEAPVEGEPEAPESTS